VKIYDTDPHRKTHNYHEVIDQDILFVAVPTPMKPTGECDTSILKEVLDRLDDHLPGVARGLAGKLVVIRSTIPPKWIGDHYNLWPHMRIVYMPEFLTERTADLDFIQSRRFIVGTGQGTDIPYELEDLFRARFPATPLKPMTWEAASLVKYGTNGFFTVKLSFFNELALFAEELGEEAQPIIDEICNDGRIGISHNRVPGHDGDRGWGGHCFPKDNRALSNAAQAEKCTSMMLDAAWLVNEDVRKNRDWESMKGRAVSDADES
jgi:UDPglucose 6-dehydrogenase